MSTHMIERDGIRYTRLSDRGKQVAVSILHERQSRVEFLISVMVAIIAVASTQCVFA